MKALSQVELERFVEDCQDLVGARLQEIMVSDRDLLLGFWTSGQLVWLALEMQASAPQFLRLPDPLPFKPKKHSPVLLFLRAHARNRILTELALLPEQGRAVRFLFGAPDDQDHCELTAWLFPHGQNLCASAQTKSVYWQKPRAHQFQESTSQSATSSDSYAPGWWRERAQQWLELRRSRQVKGQGTGLDVRERWQEDLKKKRRALIRMEEQWSVRQSEPWENVGEWLKAHQSLQVPGEWIQLVDSSQSLAENIERCFHKAKELRRKQGGHEQRKRQLEAEIEELTQRIQWQAEKEKSAVLDLANSPRAALKAATARGRTLPLAEGLVAYRGKSASDNLALLRTLRPWTLWLHLRDYPGAYGFITRRREQVVPHAALCSVARWLVEETIGRRVENGKFAIIYTECRFVRPIKGDRLGRVNYQNEKEIIVDLTKDAGC